MFTAAYLPQGMVGKDSESRCSIRAPASPRILSCALHKGTGGNRGEKECYGQELQPSGYAHACSEN